MTPEQENILGQLEDLEYYRDRAIWDYKDSGISITDSEGNVMEVDPEMEKPLMPEGYLSRNQTVDPETVQEYVDTHGYYRRK